MTATNHLDLAADGWLGGTAERTGIMETAHTPGPWDWCRVPLYNPEKPEPGFPAYCTNSVGGEEWIAKAKANASRVSACIAACKGINPEAVPGLLKAMKRIADDAGVSSMAQIMLFRTHVVRIARAAIAAATK